MTQFNKFLAEDDFFAEEIKQQETERLRKELESDRQAQGLPELTACDLLISEIELRALAHRVPGYIY